MKRRIFTILWTLIFPLFFSGFGPKLPIYRNNRTLIDSGYGRLPLAFEPNQGQADPTVQFLARGAGYTLFITSQEATLSLKKPKSQPAPTAGKRFLTGFLPKPTPDTVPPAVLRLKLEGNLSNAAFEPMERLPGVSNYFIGQDPTHWHTDIPQYSKVVAHGFYPGTDMVYYGDQGKLEYDFVVQPGADPAAIRLRIEGAQGVEVNSHGGLDLQTPQGKVVFRAPVLYQEKNGQKTTLEGSYQLGEGNRIGFKVKDYDHTRPLVIDPVLDYSTYLGGSGYDTAAAIAVDGGGNAYVTGQTTSANLPSTSGAAQAVYGGGTNGWAYVAKLNPAGNALAYSTYLGGTGGSASGTAIVLDGSDNAYVTGDTATGFPLTSGSYQSPNGDMFMAELNAAGTSIVYSALLGGGGYENSRGIAMDGSGHVYVAGFTESSAFPTTSGAFQTSLAWVEDGFVVKLNPAGGGASDLLYSTYFGASDQQTVIFAIAVDGPGDAYVTGQTSAANFPTTGGAFQTTLPGALNAFVTKLNPSGSGLVYSSFLGGNSGDWGLGIAVDGSGDAWITGQTYSTNFPTTSGAIQASESGGNDAFVAEMNPAGSALLYSTYYAPATDYNNWGNSVVIDGSGDAFIGGQSYSTNWDGFLMEFTAGGSLGFLTTLGGSGWDQINGVAVDPSGNAYVTGYTSGSFPTTSGAYQVSYGGGADDAFIAKFDASNFSIGPTSTPSSTPTATVTDSPTPTATLTASPTITATPTHSPTWTVTSTPTASGTPTPSSTVTFSPTLTPTETPIYTPQTGPPATDTPTPVTIGIGWPYPNPDKGEEPVNIPIQAAPGCSVEYKVYTTAFRKIRNFKNLMTNDAYLLTWDMDDDWKVPAANGLYYVKVEVTGPVQMSKLFKVLITR